MSPVNYKGLHQGWTQTSLHLKVINFISHHTTSIFYYYYSLAYLYSAGTQHGNLHPARWPVSFCGPTQEPVLAEANTGKNLRAVLEKKNAGEWTRRVEISEDEICHGNRGNPFTYSISNCVWVSYLRGQKQADHKCLSSFYDEQDTDPASSSFFLFFTDQKNKIVTVMVQFWRQKSSRKCQFVWLVTKN